MQHHPSLRATFFSALRNLVDHSETYGPAVMQRYLQQVQDAGTILDIGAGHGRDLGFAKQYCKGASLYAVECLPDNIAVLESMGVASYACNIETDRLPFDDAGIDLIIANQILEHTKELFWIFHEITRVLKEGGHAVIGVPNVASLHNRLGLLFGKHPTQAKACSAHVRCFSKNDFLFFLHQGFPGGYQLVRFDGSQFYPFPRALARPLGTAFPSLAFSIFFLLRKTKPYTRSFLDYPPAAMLATNFKIS